jgi:hypothetical protein
MIARPIELRVIAVLQVKSRPVSSNIPQMVARHYSGPPRLSSVSQSVDQNQRKRRQVKGVCEMSQGLKYHSILGKSS